VHIGSRTKSESSGHGGFGVTIALGTPGYIDTTGAYVWKPQP